LPTRIHSVQHRRVDEEEEEETEGNGKSDKDERWEEEGALIFPWAGF